MFLDLRAKFQKLKKKTQNSRKKLKLRENFAPPERPSGVNKKGRISWFIRFLVFFIITESYVSLP